MALVSTVTDFVVSIGSDGRANSEISVKKAIAADSFLLSEFKRDEESIQKNAEEVDAPAVPENLIPEAAGKLVVAEEKEEGLVNWSASTFNAFDDLHVDPPIQSRCTWIA